MQKMAGKSLQTDKHYADGAQSCLGVDFIGRHERNIHDESDTHNIEGSNADIRRNTAGLRRRSRCFFRKPETLKTALRIFVYACNKFGAAKPEYRSKHPDCGRDFHIDYI
jgi:hypothetical protein